MKKVTLLLLMLLTFSLPWAKAQETLTVASGTSTNNYIPFYGYNAEQTQQSQIIYPASLLTDIVDSQINELVFYSNQSSTKDYGGQWKLRLGICQNSAFSSTYYDTSTSTTEVYSGKMYRDSDGTVTITFDTPFEYTGGNLLFDLRNHVGGAWSSTGFYGISSTGASIGSTSGNSNTTGSLRNWLPKTTFNYESLASCIRPKNVEAIGSSITSSSATITWTKGEAGQNNFSVVYGTGNTPDDASMLALSPNPTTPTATLNNLSADTEYHVFVKAICGVDDESAWSLAGSFHTECNLLTVPYSYSFEDATPGTSSNNYQDNVPCWRKLNDATSSTNSTRALPYVTELYPHSGTKSLYFYQSAESSYPQNEIAILPHIDVQNSPINTLRLVFWAGKYYNNYEGSLVVGVMTDPTDASTFVAVGTAALTNVIQRHFIPLDSYTGNGEYVAIKCPPVSANYNSIYADDFTLERIPTCLEPSELDATDITDSEAELTWTSTASLFNMRYKKLGASDWEGTKNNITQPYVFDHLDSNTDYVYQVQAICTSDDLSDWSNSYVFHTECGLINLPFSFGFETSEGVTTGSSGDIPCWGKINDGSSYYYYPYVGESSYSAHSGTNYLYFYQSSSYNINNEICVMPAIDVLAYPTNTLELRFWAKKSSTSAISLIVGVMTDPEDASTFVGVQTIEPSTTYNQYVVPLSSYLGSGAYIAIKCPKPSSNYNYVYLDDIVLGLPAPTQVTATNVAAHSATINWTPGHSSHNSFVVAYGTGNDPDAQSMTRVPVSNATSLVINDLTANTEYNVFVKASLANGQESSWSELYSFQTDCDPITLPYSCGFEDATTYSIPCWNLLRDPSAPSHDYPYVYSWEGHTGTKSLYFYLTAENNYPDNEIGVLPYVNTSSTPTNTLRLKLWARTSSPASDITMTVGVMTDPDDITTFVAVKDLTMTQSYRQYSISMEEYEGTGAYIALKCSRPQSSNFAIYVDDVELDVAPSCIEPINLTPTQVFDVDAMLSWDKGSASQTLFQIAYGAGTVADDMAHVDATTIPFNLTNLSPETSYNIFVRANCGDAQNPSYSDWSPMASFTTTKTPTVCDKLHPYFEDFEGADPGFDLINGTLTNAWAIGTATNNTDNGQKALYISNNGGNANGYANNSEAVVYAAKLFSLSEGMYRFSFNWKCYGESSYDFLRVFLVPVYETLTAATNLPSGLSYSQTPAGWISLDNNYKLNLQNSWQTRSVDYIFDEAGFYNLVFLWRNDGSSGSNPPAAIDNISVTFIPCQATNAPVASNITFNSATLSWTVNDANQDSFQVAYGTGTDPDDASTMQYANADATSINLSTLTPGTNYIAYVRANCGDDGYSDWSEGYEFHTLCAPASSPLFSEDFNDIHGFGELPECWEMGWIDKGNSSTSVPFNVSENYKHGESGYSMSLYQQPEGTISYLSTQCLTIDQADKYILSVWVYRMNASSYSLEGVKFWASPNYNSTTNATLLGYVHRDYASAPAEEAIGWYNYEFVIPTSGELFILVEGISQYGAPTYFDDMEVKLAPTCWKPTHVTASNITHNSATISWTPGDPDQQNFVIAYGTGTNPNQMATVEANTNPTTLNGLFYPGTTYNVFVKSSCGDDEYSEWSSTPYTFTTNYAIPFYEEFEASTSLPVTFAKYTGLLSDILAGTSTLSTGGNWSIVTNQQNLESNRLRCYVYSSNRKDWAVTTDIYLQDEAQLTFDLALVNYYGGLAGLTGFDDKFVVLVSTDSGATWSQSNILATWDNAGSAYVYNDIATAGERVKLAMDDFAGQTVRIAFYAESTQSNASNYLYIDNIAVEYLSNCEKPYNVAATEVTNTSATLSWTPGDASEESFVVAYGTSLNPYDANLMSYTEPISTNSVTLTGLSPITPYNVFVKAKCSAADDDWSNYSRIYSFTTHACPPSDECDYTFNLVSYYNATWNNAQLQVIDVATDVVVASLTLETGTSANKAVKLCDSRQYKLKWIPGTGDWLESYYEFTLKDQYGIVLATKKGQTAGDITTFTADCTSCPAPTDLEIYSEIHSAEFDWNCGQNLTYQLQCFDSNDVMVVDTTIQSTYFYYYQFEKGTEYTVRVRTLCSESNQSEWNEEEFSTADCYTPINIELTDVTSSHAVVRWDSDYADIFGVRYTDSTTMVTTTIADKIYYDRYYTIGGLVGNTKYSVQLMCYCNEEDYSVWSEPIGFTTPAASTEGPIIAQFAENFEDEHCTIGYGEPASPHTWKTTTYYDYYEWELFDIYSSSFDIHEGQYCARTNGFYGPIYLISPQITLTGNSATLSFWDLNKYPGDYGKNSVLISTTGTNPSDFTEIWTTNHVDDTWTEHQIQIPSQYFNTPFYLAFLFEGDNAHQWYVDDIKIGTPSTANLFNIAAGNWDDATKWSKGTVPTAADYTVVSKAVTIPANYIATAQKVTLDNGGSITIAEGGQLIHENPDLTVTLQKEIAAYTGDNDHFYLIATPSLEGNTPASAGLFADPADPGYDLYYFSQDYGNMGEGDTLEWHNYRSEEFILYNTMGFLYANDVAKSLSFTGTAMPSNAMNQYWLENMSDESPEIHCGGFYLLGNPYVCNAVVDGADGYYKLNANGRLMVTSNPTLAPGEGMFIYVGSYGIVNISNANANRGDAHREGTVSIELIENGEVADRALVTAEEGNDVPKLTFKQGEPIIYFSENGRKAAKTSIVGSDAKTLNLEVNADGNYTLRLNIEGLNCSYLHLIDKLTGTDIDLLREKAYTFTASTDDDAARFKLMFRK